MDSKFYGLLLLLLFATAACMPKVEEDEVVPEITITSHAINGSSISPYITLQGSCPAGTYAIRTLVDGTEYSVTPANGVSMVAESGIPVGGACVDGKWSINYPVPNRLVSRTITFKVKAKLNDGRSSLEWAVRAVSYTPIAPGVPGFVVAAVGATQNSGVLSGLATLGVMAGSTMTMHSVGGEPYGGDPSSQPGNILTSPFVQLRSGLHGVITE